MNYLLCSILDKKSGQYQGIQMEFNKDVAMRNFANAVKISNSVVNNFAVDFDLYAVAEFNLDSGKITAYDTPLFICNGLDVKEI